MRGEPGRGPTHGTIACSTPSPSSAGSDARTDPYDTVEHHVCAVLQELGVRTRREAAAAETLDVTT